VGLVWSRVIGRPVRTGFAYAIAVLVAGGVYASSSASNTPDAGPEAATAAGCDEETTARFTPVIRWHADRYPGLQVEDLYKLLHQSVAGPAHAIEDPEMAGQWLEREWSSLANPLDAEELFEPLSSDGHLVRVNLRPWRAAGNSPAPVLDAFVQTAGTLPPDTVNIRTELDALAACSDRLADGLSLAASEIHTFFRDRAREGYPAIHHSETYEREYRPAYRIVIRSYLD